MAAEPERRSVPYTVYATAINFLEKLKEHPLPQKIDKSLMPNLSYATQPQLLAALKCMGLIADDGSPTAKMGRLVAADAKQRPAIIGEVVRETYPFLFVNGFDLKRATPEELDNKFKEASTVSGATVDKAVKFFIAAATEGGIALSPHLAQRKSSPSNGAKRKRAKRARSDGASEASPPPPLTPATQGQELVQQLLNKFPAFDPKWDKELQEAWFSGFDKLMDHTGTKRTKREKDKESS
jgi:hypothetical protein